MAHLMPRSGHLICDATVGSGGHATALLGRSSQDVRLLGIDRDPEAIARARDRLARFGARVTLVAGDFGDLVALLDGAGVEVCDGMLLDLGISSDQLDDPARGFSFSQAGPLDMRMDRSCGRSAADLLRDLTADDLAGLLARHGEQPAARRVARAVKEAWRARRIATTTDLAAVVARASPRRGRIHPATRAFMALRIAVNDELGSLERFLSTFAARLRPGGRVVVIAFHSLEDRLVKHRLRDLARPDRDGPRLRVLTRKPVRPGEDEMARNPRSRSARLRAAERVA